MLIVAAVSITTVIYQYTDGFVTGLFDSTKIQKMGFTVSEIGNSYRYNGSFINSGGNSITVNTVYILYGDGLFDQGITAFGVGSNDSFSLGSDGTFVESGSSENCYKVSDVSAKCSAGTAVTPGLPTSGDEVGLIIKYSTSDGQELEFFEKTKVQ